MTLTSDEGAFNPHGRGVLDVDQAALFLGLTRTYLANMRFNRRGPEFHKHRNRIYYTQSELQRWNKARLAKNSERKNRAAERRRKAAPDAA